MTVDLLEERLRELDIPTPDAGRVSAQALARKSQGRRVVVPRLASVPAALVLITALVVYFVPAADLAIADKTPWSSEVLQWAGLVGAKDRITVVNSTASSSGYTLTLQGAYADSTRTVLLLHIEPAAFIWVNPALTDQFSRSYSPHGGVENLLTGDMSTEFEPLAWPDSITGARITLHVPQVETASHERVAGNWDVTATLRMDVAQSLPAPAAGDLGPAHVRFGTVRFTPATIEVDVEVTGVSLQELTRVVPNGVKGRPAMLIELFDPNGQGVGGVWGSGQLFGYRTGKGGTYVIRVSYYGYGSFERVINIPS